jgi:hypothetical protein
MGGRIMAVTYGFFNSQNGDRTYDADQMSEYFDGLVSNGVYESVGGALRVVASTGMEVNVQTGRAIINCKWINNSSVNTLTITGSHPTLNRWTAVVLRLDIVNRLIAITTKDGTNASEPVKPTMQNDGTMVELCLAYIYVAAGATTLTQANITDMRGSNLCGWVTGLIEQVDTSTLFDQYNSAYAQYYAQMTAAFDAWFSTLTEELNVETYVQHFRKHNEYTSSVTTTTLDMTGYTYSADDIIQVYINGLYGQLGVDYTINTSGTYPIITTTAQAAGTEVDVLVLKSKIGFNTLVGSNGNTVVGSNGNEIGIA